MAIKLKIGIANRGILHHNSEANVSLEDWFKEVSQSKAFDYVDKTPPKEDFNQFQKYSEKYDLPILCGGWFYRLGEDDELLKENLKLGAELGSKFHNVQIFLHHNDGHILSDIEIAEKYLEIYEFGEKTGCLPCFEIHINMWSEDFLRIETVANIVRNKGATFRMTLDHSHVIFKIDNKEEMGMFDLKNQLISKKIILDPFVDDNISDKWINEGLIWLMHARSVIPNNPKNIKGRHPDGTVGRGVQYPFIKPLPGQYHTEWDGSKLIHWKEVIKKMLKYHFENNSPLECISTEFIPATDYGEGNTYSLFDNAVACANWIREEMNNYI